MKTNLTIMSAIVLAVVSTSCTKNSVDDDSSLGLDPSKITFNTSVAKTKANDNDLPELKGGFNVIATDKAGEYLPGFAAPAGDNVTYIFNDPAWDWKNQTIKGEKVWPLLDTSYPLAFYAAYPLSTTVTKDASSAPANVVSNLTPALFEYNTYYHGAPIAFDATKSSVDELAALSPVYSRPVTGLANLSFKHIMANMKFKITVPENHEAYIHSIKIVNVNKSGRSYDYKTGLWGAEPTYDVANNAHYAYFIASAGQPIKIITSTAGDVEGLKDATSGFNTPKLMPQKVVTKWALGDATTPAAKTFRADAAAWTASLAGGAVDAAAITKWHNEGTATQGMSDSEGWKGARIEVIYCLVDKNGGAGKEKNVIGYKSGIDGAAQDLMVRVGYVLDIASIDTNKGWSASKRYTFEIPLGMAKATNGTLLDPDFKNSDGTNTDKPVDKPATKPGEVITKGGIIQFEVDVDNWTDATGIATN